MEGVELAKVRTVDIKDNYKLLVMGHRSMETQ